jgi:hypothetical protein
VWGEARTEEAAIRVEGPERPAEGCQSEPYLTTIQAAKTHYASKNLGLQMSDERLQRIETALAQVIEGLDRLYQIGGRRLDQLEHEGAERLDAIEAKLDQLLNRGKLL